MVSFTTLLLAATASLTTEALNVPRDTSQPLWLTLPRTPDLPTPISSTLYPINGVKLWLQKYNEAQGKIPIVMSHGGLGDSAYFAAVIKELVRRGHYVIASDRRGHGRSTFNADDVFTYDMFARDQDALLKAVGVNKYVFVGWSDGAIQGLSALMNRDLAASIQKAFLFGTTASPADTNNSFATTAIYAEFISRVRNEYAALHPDVQFKQFATKVAQLESTLPNFTDADFAKIDGAKVTMVEAEHEEAVNKGTGQIISSKIKGSKFVSLLGGSHFAPLQIPARFADAVERSLR
ncbi:uncharacterized protein PpBr36_10686 [Pyricularia pennisetigena]|uniref:uncharacterized protein n=1 Tax=Pyricularia pennisetigena TaxID=1578925 RepID=UPI00114FA9B4|nr:uncharacterized protein PpBr36_10686 [Pyricularia pennisetigena]TLS20834.1 hypothetical protein PpBr36_10686 [Pyricularia pennisetigena]